MTEEPKEAALKEPMGGPMPADAKENSGPTGEQLLDKYVQAAGGAAAIDKVSSRVNERDDRFWREISAHRYLFEGSGETHLVHTHAGGRQRYGVQWA